MLQKAVIASGGNVAANSGTAMDVTIGQPATGVATNGQTVMQYGFWTAKKAASGVTAEPQSSLALDVWPNPAQEASTIAVTLPNAATLDLRLFDVTGKEVKAIYNGNQPAGKNSVAVNFSTLPSGTYILAARIPGQLVQKQISIIR